MNSFQRVLCVECKVNFGSEQRQGMCSVCFKTKEITPVEEVFEEEVFRTEEILEIKKETTIENKLEEEAIKSDKPQQKSKFHCFTCETKVGYLGFLCKCEYIYCGKHRHFSEHNCTFDFKAYDRQKLISKK